MVWGPNRRYTPASQCVELHWMVSDYMQSSRFVSDCIRLCMMGVQEIGFFWNFKELRGLMCMCSRLYIIPGVFRREVASTCVGLCRIAHVCIILSWVVSRLYLVVSGRKEMWKLPRIARVCSRLRGVAHVWIVQDFTWDAKIIHMCRIAPENSRLQTDVYRALETYRVV